MADIYYRPAISYEIDAASLYLVLFLPYRNEWCTGLVGGAAA